jgi:poly-beta-1,6-N-acetyl-D-glucosamine synthase
MKYIVVSPVKDEERFVEHTIQSMVCQSVKPLSWFIVDDGSSDRTVEIIERYEKEHGFISLVKRPRGQPRQTGVAEIHAFNRGLEAAEGLDYDFIVKLDGDLSFESDYFKGLLEKFYEDPQLGIASGIYSECSDGVAWEDVVMPSYHAAGASKLVRKICFDQIGGFIPVRGWDTLDEIRAMTHGWRTGHFREMKMKHWKREGSGMGALRTNFMHGEIYYRTGGSLMFFALKVLHRFTCRPFFIGGLALLWGYLQTMFSQQERIVNQEEARCYRSLLSRRLVGNVKRLFQSN